MPKTKNLTEAQFLELLQKVLSQLTKDAHLATNIYNAVAKEVNLHKSLQSFEKFCETGSIPDMEATTVADLQSELQGKFGDENVSVTPAENGEGLAVEISLPDRTVSSQVRVSGPDDPKGDEAKPPFVPFPVSLPSDPELVWVLGRREDLGPDEAARALVKIEEEFWQTKKGQQLQRDRVEKTFAEFILQVPASALTESGLKRHYKQPETLKTLRLMGSGGGGGLADLMESQPKAERPPAAEREEEPRKEEEEEPAEPNHDSRPPWEEEEESDQE